jgi:hypothetical protein
MHAPAPRALANSNNGRQPSPSDTTTRRTDARTHLECTMVTTCSHMPTCYALGHTHAHADISRPGGALPMFINRVPTGDVKELRRRDSPGEMPDVKECRRCERISPPWKAWVGGRCEPGDALSPDGRRDSAGEVDDGRRKNHGDGRAVASVGAHAPATVRVRAVISACALRRMPAWPGRIFTCTTHHAHARPSVAGSAPCT